jgi:hypothetical protein
VVTNPDTQSGTLTNGFTYTGLITHWTFDEGTGQTAADSVGTNDGTLGSTTGAEANDPTWVCVTGGNALSFDGSDDAVGIPNDASLNFGAGQSFSFSAWVKYAGTDATQTVFRYR